jgi:methyl-accepting chemotaxis protein
MFARAPWPGLPRLPHEPARIDAAGETDTDSHTVAQSEEPARMPPPMPNDGTAPPPPHRDASPLPSHGGARVSAALRALVSMLSVAGGAAALQLGGWPGVAAAAAATGATLLVVNRWRRQVDTPEPTSGRAETTRFSLARETVLALQVVPVWKRNLEAARTHSERSSEALLESFARVSGHLDHALGSDPMSTALDVGAADELLERHRPQIDALLATTRASVRMKDEMQALMLDMAAEIEQMASLTREVQNVGRATQLLALNAAAVATRAGSAGSAFGVMAREVRAQAGQSRQAGLQLGKQLASMKDRIELLRRQARRAHADDDDELTLRATQEARAVVLSLIASLAEVSRASRELRLAGRQVQSDLEKIFIGLQSQDRLSQMLNSVTDDLARYQAWLHGAADPAAASAPLWLERLEASYTMEDMRSSLHGATAIEQQTTVEFF